MDEKKNIKNYSTADIEKYWTGRLSAAEMHAMEKAAMEDAFLAEAMEGYKNSQSTEADIQSLKEKLSERLHSELNTIPLSRGRFPWLKIAAAIIIIGGLGVLAQQLFFKPEKNELALTEKNTAPVADSLPELKVSDAEKKDSQPPANLEAVKAEANAINRTPVLSAGAENDSARNKAVVTEADAGLKNDDKEIKIQEAVVSSNAISTKDKELVAAAKTKQDSISETGRGLVSGDVSKVKKQEFGIRTNKKTDGYLNLNHSYIYRVVDAQNNPVPFANVMNTRDNVGTYTDIKGQFNLISSDSMMDVQIRSLGYNSLTCRLFPSAVPNSIVMQEDEKARSEILANTRKVVSSRAREETAELEEPEVGWSNYNTYVANNINIPEEILPKNSSAEVELSFNVDKNGQPVNIKVTKSSECKKCDEEAVRLLKEGPKWKRKGNRSKTTVSISVDKN
jgi:TonB family protein